MRKQILAGTARAAVSLALVFVGCGLQQQKSAILLSVLAERPPAAAPQLPLRRYLFPVQGCPFNYGPTHHDYPATDIFTRRGCAFVAVTDGRVDEVSSVDRWDPRTNRGRDRGGRSVSIVGTDGVRYYGAHLDSIASGIVPGKLVRAGDLLGRVDNSGDARSTPTHVHFGISWPTRAGIWCVRRGEVSPWPYLNSWRSGGSRSPVVAVASAHRHSGDEPPCRVEC
jgi:peptidoglycan LD-endopeptidase LytH